MLFSVNKMLRGLSNAGRGLCVGRSRIYREAWVADFAMSGWVGLAQMRGYWPPIRGKLRYPTVPEERLWTILAK